MIVCIGDSISSGQHVAPEACWVSLLGYTGAGVPGDTTRMGLERFPADVQQRAPEIVVIQFGHNDANRWATDRGLPRVSPPAFHANLTEMVERCRKFGAVPYLCSVTPSFRSEEHARDCERYDHILRRVADETTTRLIDVRPRFDATLILPDGLHLNEAGHHLYAEIVRQAL